jgi:hypothetical protein
MAPLADRDPSVAARVGRGGGAGGGIARKAVDVLGMDRLLGPLRADVHGQPIPFDGDGRLPAHPGVVQGGQRSGIRCRVGAVHPGLVTAGEKTGAGQEDGKKKSRNSEAKVMESGR